MISYLKEYFNFKAFAICILLVVIGLMSVYSSTYDLFNANHFYKQSVWAIIGFVCMIIIAFIPLRSIERFSFVAYSATLTILVIVLIVGSTIKGAKSWFAIGGIGGQPSEFAKITTVLAFAAYLSKSNVSLSNTKHFLTALAIFISPMFLIMCQPDLGTTIIFLATLLPMLYWVGASNFILVAIIVPIITAFAALFNTHTLIIAVIFSAVLIYIYRESRFSAAVAFGITLAIALSVNVVYDRLPSYQQKRISTFLNPGADPLGAGYNVDQSITAIGSGGFFGTGYLKGTQTQLNYIPEQWTDFIYCVPGEEFGFIGASLVLGLFVAIALHGINLASASKNKFGSIASIGIVAIFSSHSIINIGMAMGFMPVIGVPLPFLSYGGSAIVANMIMIGLLMNFYANRKQY